MNNNKTPAHLTNLEITPHHTSYKTTTTTTSTYSSPKNFNSEKIKTQLEEYKATTTINIINTALSRLKEELTWEQQEEGNKENVNLLKENQQQEQQGGEDKLYSHYKSSCNNKINSNYNDKKSFYIHNTSVATTNMSTKSMINSTRWSSSSSSTTSPSSSSSSFSWWWNGGLRPSTAACVTLLILTTTCSLCSASLCESQSWWDAYKDKCIPCTVCQGDMIPLRPCQMHRDTVCGSIYDLKIDWVVLSKTEPNWKERRKFDGLDYGGLDHHQLTAEQLQQLQDEADPMDWQTAALFLAVLACLLFFIVAACILVHHMRQWRRMERRLDQDVEELSTKLMAKLAEVQSLEGGTFFIGNADALRIPTTTTTATMTTATTFHQPQHVMLPEKSDKHQQNLQHDRRLFSNTTTLKSGNVYIEENSSKC